MENNKLYNWCLEQAANRFLGKLTQEQFEKLNSIDFPWAYYEDELDKLGFHTMARKDELNCYKAYDRYFKRAPKMN